MKQYLIEATAYCNRGKTCVIKSVIKLEAAPGNANPIILTCDGVPIGKNYKSFSAASRCLEKIVTPWKTDPDVIAIEIGNGRPCDIPVRLGKL